MKFVSYREFVFLRSDSSRSISSSRAFCLSSSVIYSREVPANGLGISGKKLRAAVEPATVQMFDSYLSDDTDERHYYI